MAQKLFVGGLPYTVTNQDLQNIFAPHGTVVSAVVIMDKFSGRSKGFGFVEMASDEDAKNAQAKVDGTELEGRTIHVNEARPMEKRDYGSGGGSRGGSGGGHQGGGGGGYNNRGNDRDRGNRW